MRGTLDSTENLLPSTYILNGSQGGGCETDDGTGTLEKRCTLIFSRRYFLGSIAALTANAAAGQPRGLEILRPTFPAQVRLRLTRL